MPKLEKQAAGQEAGSKNDNGKEKQAPAKAKPKRYRRHWRLLVPVTAAVTFVVVTVCAVTVLNTFRDSGSPLFGSSATVELPNLVGSDETAVREMLDKSPYNKLVKEYVYEYDPDDATIGKVILQRPSPKTVKATQKVVLVINQGPQEVEVPNTTGMDRKTAEKTISDAGLMPYVKTVYDTNGGQLGKVFNTEPAAGSKVKNAPDENVVVINIVGQRIGAKTVKVPGFVGMLTVAEAQNLAADSNLELSITEEVSEEPAGTILGQSPAAGTSVLAYSTVRVTVAVGPQAEAPAA